jgi:putative membrane protein
VFSFRGTVLPEVLGRVGFLTGLSLVLELLEEYVLDIYGRPLPALDQLGHTVLGIVLGMVIVFRTNTAFARFWEARSHWGGLLNASRNLARFGAAHAGPADDLGRLITAFAVVLKETLRETRDFTPLRSIVPGALYDQLSKANGPCSVVARAMSDWVHAKITSGRLLPIQAVQMETWIGELVDRQGGCEKILRTPVPFVYAALIKQVLLLYLVTLPFVLVAKMGYAAPLAVAGVSLCLLGIEEAGVEIEQPFEIAPNNLPLEAICETIAKEVSQITGA